MRVYLGTTLAALAQMRARGVVPPSAGHAVTDWLRGQWPEGSEEEWEYAVLAAAADDSAALLDGTQGRRVVVVVEASSAEPAEPDSTATRTTTDTPWRHVAAVHADAEDGGTGDLGWYAVQEVDTLLG